MFLGEMSMFHGNSLKTPSLLLHVRRHGAWGVLARLTPLGSLWRLWPVHVPFLPLELITTCSSCDSPTPHGPKRPQESLQRRLGALPMLWSWPSKSKWTGVWQRTEVCEPGPRRCASCFSREKRGPPTPTICPVPVGLMV